MVCQLKLLMTVSVNFLLVVDVKMDFSFCWSSRQTLSYYCFKIQFLNQQTFSSVYWSFCISSSENKVCLPFQCAFFSDQLTDTLLILRVFTFFLPYILFVFPPTLQPVFKVSLWYLEYRQIAHVQIGLHHPNYKSIVYIFIVNFLHLQL